MTGRKNRETQALDRLADALVEDTLNTSSQDILAEFREEIDPDQHAADMLARFERVVMAANKAKLIAAKAAVAIDRDHKPRLSVPIDIEEARRRLRSAMASQPMTVAARNETEMTDSDVLGMLEDLKELGVVPPDDKA